MLTILEFNTQLNYVVPVTTWRLTCSRKVRDIYPSDESHLRVCKDSFLLRPLLRYNPLKKSRRSSIPFVVLETEERNLTTEITK